MRAIDADALKEDLTRFYDNEVTARKLIDEQPTIQPDNNSENPNGSDVISRQAAIDALRNYLVGKNVPCDGTLACRLIENEVVNKLPSAQLGTYWEEQCQSYEQTINKLIESLSTQPEIVRCKDCYWWTKQEDSPQGRCALLQMYPTGGWFCGNARRREVTE